MVMFKSMPTGVNPSDKGDKVADRGARASKPHVSDAHAEEVEAQRRDTAPRDGVSRLQEFRELKNLTNNDHGFGYMTKPDGSAVLVIASLENNNIITVPTRLSATQFDELKKELLDIPETQLMLYELAVAYANRTPILLEGGTAIGKTFAVNTFAKMLYGPNAKIPDFYCNGQTDVSELMGKHVPAGLTPQQLETLNTYLKSDAGQVLREELKRDTGTVEMKELMERAALELGLPVQQGSFVFQLGVLPKAMTGTMAPDGRMLETHDGPGCMLHVQEVGMAAPSVINALLKIRGVKGKLAADIQVHEDGGRLIEAGEEFFLVFSTNPPGKGFKERFDIDSALARALVWKSLPDELSNKSLQKIATRIFDFSRVERRDDAMGAIVDLEAHTALAETLGAVAYRFHRVFVDKLRDGEPGRKQKIPATIDSLWKLAELLQNHQIPHANESRVDFADTLKEAIRSVYVDGLREKPSRIPTDSLDTAAQENNSIGAALLKELEAILNDRTIGVVEHQGKKMTPLEKIARLNPDLTPASAQVAKPKVQEAAQAARSAATGVRARDVMGQLEGLLGGDALKGVKDKLGLSGK